MLRLDMACDMPRGEDETATGGTQSKEGGVFQSGYWQWIGEEADVRYLRQRGVQGETPVHEVVECQLEPRAQRHSEWRQVWVSGFCLMSA